MIEDFKLLGYVTQRIKFTKVDYMAKAASPKAYRNCSFNKLVDQKIDAAVGPSHSFEVEQRVMVDIYLEKNERMPGRIAKKWDALNVLAQERLYLSKDLAQKVENDIATKVGLSQHRMEVLADIKREHKTQHMNQHYQYTRDLYAADNPNVLRVIKNKDIFLAIDENNVILVFVLSRAVQTLFSEQVVDSIIESSQKWAYLQVVPTQRNDIRHRMEPLDHLRRNPQFDVDAADDSHHAVCGVAHYGCHCPVGHPNGPVYKTRGALCGYQKDYLFHTYPKQILKNRLQHGAFRVVTEVASFCFQNIAPDLRSQYVEACSRTDRDERFDRMKKGEPFTLMAFLANSHTQDHRDSSDWIHGLASLVNVGDFTGKWQK